MLVIHGPLKTEQSESSLDCIATYFYLVVIFYLGTSFDNIAWMAIFHRQLGIPSLKRTGIFVLPEVTRQINYFTWFSKTYCKLSVVYAEKSLSVPCAEWSDLKHHETEYKNSLGIIAENKTLKNFVRVSFFSFVKKCQHTKRQGS